MREFRLSLFLSMVLLVPKLGNAQVYSFLTPPPAVTAAGTSWQASGEPVFYAGNIYYPTGPTVFFDGAVMVRTGVYRNIPLYEDSTIEPYSIVFVPIGGNVMRPYERRRSGELAGTVGSRMPSFPIERDVEVSARSGLIGIQTPPLGPAERTVLPEAARSQATTMQVNGTFTASGSFTTTSGGGSIAVQSPSGQAAAVQPAGQAPAQRIESIPAPQSNSGIWIEFDGARWSTA